jgi:hypothetical protein
MTYCHPTTATLSQTASFRLCLAAPDWAIEPLLTPPFAVVDSTRPHGAGHACVFYGFLLFFLTISDYF